MMTDETRKAMDGEAAGAGAQQPANDDAGRAEAGADGAGAPQPSAEEQLAEAKDRVLRTLAEMENLRNRTAREIEDARKYAVTGFARDLLEVADNLGRALASVPQEARENDEAVKNLMLGVEMTQRSLLGALEKHRVRRIEPQKGDRFDPNLHQAMFEVPTDQQAPGTVAEVMQAGYVLADRLLRPALVGVAKAANGQAQPAAKVDTTA
jgi:molecular chaperone GrpE